MPSYEEMSLEEIDATMAMLRERRRTLKSVSKVAERKIATLARRRERLMDRIREVDTQIETLRREALLEGPMPMARRRSRRPKFEQGFTE